MTTENEPETEDKPATQMDEFLRRWRNDELDESDFESRPATPAEEERLDELMGLEAITLRLPQSTAQDLRDLAEERGLNLHAMLCNWIEDRLTDESSH